MGKSRSPDKQPPAGGRTNFASCLVAAIFLIFLIIAAFVVYFTVFRPKDPKLTVNAIQIPAFSAAPNSTVNFTISQYVTITNPNRVDFSHYDSSLQLLYAGNQVGLLFVPAGKIAAGRTQYMAATFSVNSFPLQTAAAFPWLLPPPHSFGGFDGFRPGPNMEVETRLDMDEATVPWPPPPPTPPTQSFGGLDGFRAGPNMEVETKLEIAGRVGVLHFFTHHVEARADCRVAIAVSGGSLSGFHC